MSGITLCCITKLPHAVLQGQLEMDSKQFIKLCRDSGILDGRQLTATAADLAFIAKAKPLVGRARRLAS